MKLQENMEKLCHGEKKKEERFCFDKENVDNWAK